MFYKEEPPSLKIVPLEKNAFLSKKKPFSSDHIDYMLEVNAQRENQQPEIIQSPEFMQTPLLLNEKSPLVKTPSLFNYSSENWQSKPDLSTKGHSPKNQYTTSNSLAETVSYYQSPGLFEDKMRSVVTKTLKKSRTIENPLEKMNYLEGNTIELGDIAEQKSMEDVMSPKKSEKHTLNKEFQILFDIKDEYASAGKQDDYKEDSSALGNEEEDFRLLNTIFPTKKQVLVMPLQQQGFLERKTLKIDTMAFKNRKKFILMRKRKSLLSNF